MQVVAFDGWEINVAGHCPLALWYVLCVISFWAVQKSNTCQLVYIGHLYMKQTVLISYHWVNNVLRFFTGRCQYLALYPPLFNGAVVYSRASGRFLNFKLRRGTSDVASLVNVIFTEDYTVRSEAHAQFVADRYNAYLKQGLKPLIVDCGANVGMSAAYFGDRYPEAVIAAIEPDAGNVELARKNASSSNVIHIQAAVASTPGMLEIVDAQADTNAFRVRPATEGTTRGVTVSEIVEKFGRERETVPFLVKIDIEGFEADLFSQDADWIDDFDVAYIELHDYMLPGHAVSANFLNVIAPLRRDFLVNTESIVSIRYRDGAEE